MALLAIVVIFLIWVIGIGNILKFALIAFVALLVISFLAQILLPSNSNGEQENTEGRHEDESWTHAGENWNKVFLEKQMKYLEDRKKILLERSKKIEIERANLGTKQIALATMYKLSNGAEEELKTVDAMSGRDFEYWCANLLKNVGYTNVFVTRGSGDRGVDITASFHGDRCAIQCKCYSYQNVGNRSVQEVYTGRAIYKCQKGIVITNQYFTKNAIQDAIAVGVQLWDRNTLRGIINQTSKVAISEAIKMEKEIKAIVDAIDTGTEEIKSEMGIVDLEMEMVKAEMEHQYDQEFLASILNEYLEGTAWPFTSLTRKINTGFYQTLPSVPRIQGMRDLVKCYPIGGDTDAFDPYQLLDEDPNAPWILEFYTEGFETKDECEHFLNAVTKRYYAKIQDSIRYKKDNFYFRAFAPAPPMRGKFNKQESRCYFLLENWAN